MLNAFLNIFRIPDLRNKVFFTLGMLIIYRIGFWVPLVGVDQAQVAEVAQKATEDATEEVHVEFPEATDSPWTLKRWTAP